MRAAEATCGVEPFDGAGDLDERFAMRLDRLRMRDRTAPGHRGMLPLYPRLWTRRHVRLTPLDQRVKVSRIRRL